jgi:hypothetical protein
MDIKRFVNMVQALKYLSKLFYLTLFKLIWRQFEEVRGRVVG